MSNPSWNINPVTGDYVMDATGKPVVNSDLKTPAYFRLSVNRTSWMYAPDANYGSDFYLLRKKQTPKDATSVEAIANRALQPMIDDGRASSVTATLLAQDRGSAAMGVLIIDAQGKPTVLPLETIGV